MRKRIISVILSALMISSSFMALGSVSAEETGAGNNADTYEIYPIPQSITYDGGEFALDKVNIHYTKTLMKLQEITQRAHLRTTDLPLSSPQMH